MSAHRLSLPFVAGLALLCTGCWETTTRTSSTYTSGPTPQSTAETLERQILDGMVQDGVPGATADCPDIDLSTSGTHVCTVEAGDVTFDYDVTLTVETGPDGEDRVRVGRVARGVHFARALEEQLLRTMREQSDVAVEAECERPPVWRSTVGETVPCVVRAVQSGEEIRAVATITNDQGGVSMRNAP